MIENQYRITETQKNKNKNKKVEIKIKEMIKNLKDQNLLQNDLITIKFSIMNCR